MRMSFGAGREQGLTRNELLVVMLVICALAAIFIVIPDRNYKARALRIQCVNNLREVGMAERIWEGDHGGHNPGAVSVTNGGVMGLMNGTNAFLFFQTLSNQLQRPKSLFCPADANRIQATTFDLKPIAGGIPFLSNSNVSYFVGLDANESDPQAMLMGDRNITNGTPLRNGILELSPNRPAGWTSELHNGVGLIVLADGSVQQESMTGLRYAATNPPAFTNRLLMPVLGP